jgi:hypothetical protein
VLSSESIVAQGASAEFEFYPNYGEDGASVECLSDGNAPQWIVTSMMKPTASDCCASYFYQSWSDDCNSGNPYYPNFEHKICINDGKQESWMAGDYLVDDMWDCCHNFFQHDDELLSRCTEMPVCNGCDWSEYLAEHAHVDRG